MLKKLRIKFILLNMITVAAVMVVVFGTVCYLDFRTARMDVERQLTAQAERGQAFVPHGSWPFGGEGFPPEASFEGFDGGPGARHEIGGMDDSMPDFPVAVYLLTWEVDTDDEEDPDEIDDATLTLISQASSAAISEDMLEDLAEAAAALPDGLSKLPAFDLYCARSTFDSTVVVAFADMSTTGNWKRLALILALVGLAALGVFFVISLFFSKWALRPVQEAWDKERRFVADVSHDLKTPLTVILANNAILRERPEATVTEMSQWVESTQTEALEMQTMVNDMLELSRFDAADSGQAQANVSTTAQVLDFSGIVEAQALMFESVAWERGINLTDEVAPGLKIRGQAPACTRLVSSLIDNACKYTPEGETITVKLEASEDGKWAIYAVNNTGAVISPEDLPHLFDRFYRTDAARTSGTGSASTMATGHGLGLAIAQSIAIAHGGTLTATSDAAHGTTFTARLPLV